MWDPGIWQSAREGKKWRPVYYYTPPLAPRRFLQGGTDGNAKFGKLKVRPVSARAVSPWASSVVVYIPNGTDWNHVRIVEIFEKNHQVGYRCLAESPAGASDGSFFLEILFADLFVNLVAGLRHLWSRSGTLRDVRVRDRAFSAIWLIPRLNIRN